MSAQHHSEAEIAAQRRMLEEFLGKAKPTFPRGKLAPNDQGELAFAVATDPERRAVVIRFSKPVDWIGLDRASALHLAGLLTSRANDLQEEGK